MATLSWILDVNSPNAAKTFDQISLRMKDLDASLKKTREIAVGDRSAMATFAKLQVQADRFGDKIHNMPLTLEGAAKAEATLLGLEATADRLNEKLNKKSTGSTLGGLGKTLISGAAFKAAAGGFGGGGGASGAAEAAAGAGGSGITDFLASPAGLGAGAATLTTLAPLVDALLGQGLGSGGALAGAALVKKYQPAVLAPGLTNISKTLSTVTQSFGPSLGLMFTSFGKSFQSLAPQLAKFFGATLPFMRQFLTLGLQAAKTILPAMTSALQEMVKSGALKAMTQGFVFLIQGVAGFIRAIGPGFKAGSEIFRAAMLGVKGILIGLGATFGWLGKIAGEWLTSTHKMWDSFRHDTAVIFDHVRHDIAHYWDMIFSNTIGRMERGRHDIAKEWDAWRHDTASTFDGVRHDIAHYWDVIYNDTIGQVIKIDKDVLGWFGKLPGQIKGALGHLGSDLMSLGKTALNDMLSGLKSVGGSIYSWLKNFVGGIPHDIMSFLHMSPPHPGSAFYDLGANLMHHFEAGIKSRAGSVAGAVHGSVGAAGSGVQRWAPLVLQVLRMLHQPAGDLGVVLSQMTTESGGNPYAINLTDSNAAAGDPSKGLMQVIGSTFNAYAGPYRSLGQFSPIASIYAGLNYAIHRYGAAWTSVLGHGHGYAHGGVISEPIFGVGRSGRAYTFGERGEETVIPGRHAPPRRGPLFGDVHIHNEVDAQIVMQRLSFAVAATGLASDR